MSAQPTAGDRRTAKPLGDAIALLHSRTERSRARHAMTDRVPLDVACLSHPGMVRTHNEDSVFVDAEAGLAVLADGMGGYSAGEVASGIAVNVVSNGLLPELRRAASSPRWTSRAGSRTPRCCCSQQIAAANKGIYEAAQARPECAGMGTTIVAAVFFGNRVSIGHIGDSRCYRLRGEKFEQLTHDHSLLQEQIDSGQITNEQAKLLAQQEPGDARARHRGDRAGGHRRVPARAGRHLPAVLGRPHRHGRARGRAGDRRRQARRARARRRPSWSTSPTRTAAATTSR